MKCAVSSGLLADARAARVIEQNNNLRNLRILSLSSYLLYHSADASLASAALWPGSHFGLNRLWK